MSRYLESRKADRLAEVALSLLALGLIVVGVLRFVRPLGEALGRIGAALAGVP